MSTAVLHRVLVLPSQAFALAGLLVFGSTGLAIHNHRNRKVHR
jgi:hypothetical protein